MNLNYDAIKSHYAASDAKDFDGMMAPITSETRWTEMEGFPYAGTYVGRKNLEDTLFKTNLEAAQAIARQLRLRNLGGIIIVDFIDMTDDDHKRQVLRALEKALSRDRAKVYVTEMSLLGLVEITRKRTRESLERILCEPCPVCDGRSVLKTA